MKSLRFLFRYLFIGLLVGAGILLIDQLYFAYGKPQQVVLLEDLMEDFGDIQADVMDIAGLNKPPGIIFRAFGNEIRFEEPCEVFMTKWPRASCDDYPHFTTIRLSEKSEDFNEQIGNLELIAVDGSFRNEEIGRFRVVQYSGDKEKMSSWLNSRRVEQPRETQGTTFSIGDGSPSYSALICTEAECLTIFSGSRTKVAGLIAQAIQQ